MPMSLLMLNGIINRRLVRAAGFCVSGIAYACKFRRVIALSGNIWYSLYIK